jgi:hypothetical protein
MIVQTDQPQQPRRSRIIPVILGRLALLILLGLGILAGLIWARSSPSPTASIRSRRCALQTTSAG